MRIVPFNRDNHMPHVIELLSARNMDLRIINDLPQHGLIAFESSSPVALGFIRCIEGPYAMLDSYISNPSMDADTRDRALNHITRKLIGIAKVNQVDKILAFSGENNIITRAINHGFHTTSFRFVIRNAKD